MAGRWVHKEDGLRVDMQFRADGQCTAIATGATKRSTLTGTYRLGPGELIVTPRGGKPITYALKINADRIALSGGDFDDSVLEFAKRGEATDANAPSTPAVAVQPSVVAERAPIRPLDAPRDKVEQIKLPGGVWDMSEIAKRFRILKVRYDSVAGTVVWMLEAGEHTNPFVVQAQAMFYDEDDVRLTGILLAWEPVPLYHKGDRVRATLRLPQDAVMTKVRKVVIKEK